MPLRLVVKSGSNRRAKTSGGIPDPVSVTVISAYARPARVGDEVGDHLFDLAEIDHGAKLIAATSVSIATSSPAKARNSAT